MEDFFFFLNAMEVKIACGVLELWQGLNCENSQRSCLQQSVNPFLGSPRLTKKLNRS